MKVFVTCGPTWVALDDTRVISNASTGEMGRLIAGEFTKAGAKVTVLQGPISFEEFARAFKTECAKGYDIVVHAAAVSDFKPAKARKTKVGSNKAWTLTLVPTEKLINRVKRISSATLLVGFKLESSLTAAVKGAGKLFTEGGCDLVVANSKVGGYQACILDADGKVLAKGNNKKNIARILVSLLI